MDFLMILAILVVIILFVLVCGILLSFEAKEMKEIELVQEKLNDDECQDSIEETVKELKIVNQ